MSCGVVVVVVVVAVLLAFLWREGWALCVGLDPPVATQYLLDGFFYGERWHDKRLFRGERPHINAG